MRTTFSLLIWYCSTFFPLMFEHADLHVDSSFRCLNPSDCYMKKKEQFKKQTKNGYFQVILIY